jgi:Protein of unknown function (DUF2726)
MPEAMLNSVAAIPFEADPWLAGFTVFGVVIILGLIAWIVRSFLQPTVYIEAVDSLLTTTEQKFYEALDMAVDGRLLILSKIRVADLFNVSSESRSARKKFSGPSRVNMWISFWLRLIYYDLLRRSSSMSPRINAQIARNATGL